MKLLIALALGLAATVALAGAPPPIPPADVGLDEQRLTAIDDVVGAALDAKQLPGCVVLVLRHGQIAWLRAYGHKRLLPQPEAMQVDTLFDLASLTKPIATATSVVHLAESGKLAIGDPLSKHLPDFAGQGKERITIEQLLVHTGGLIADNNLDDYADGPTAVWQRICSLTPLAEPGEKFIYSDVGYIVLGELVRRVSGEDLHAYTRRHIFGPLGMTETGFLPAEELQARAAPTEQRDGRWLQGEVHDPRAAKLGGVAGHAGVFGTARDLAIYAQMMLGRGQHRQTRVLSEASVAEMLCPRDVGSGWRALGWDVRSGYSTNRGAGFSQRAFGHGGFTGTSIWIDAELDLAVLFLSNRLHPDGKGSVNALAGRIGTIVAESVVAAPGD